MTTPAQSFTRLLPMLSAQLVPAVLVAAVGMLLLNGLSKSPIASEDEVKAPRVINAEAVFTPTPRDRDEPVIAARAEDAKSIASALARIAVKPKPAATTLAMQTRKPAEERVAPSLIAPNPILPGPIASASQPMPIVPTAETAPPAASSANQNVFMGTLRGATASLQRLPERMADSMSGWFTEGEPPRPPAPIPMQQFQAAM